MPTARNEGRPFRCGPALALLTALTAGLALAFHRWPGLDIVVSGLFHDPATGFSLAGRRFWDAVVLANKAASFVYVATALLLLPVRLWQRGNDARGATRYWAMVILLYVTGPGLLVNGLLKRLFGRARPVEIVLFGGDGPFTAAWEVSDYCRSACSFVSAEAASGTALAVGLAMGSLWFASHPATARRFRRLAFAAAGLLLLTSVQRIGSGRHYLSDIVFATLPVAALGLGLACLLWPRTAPSGATNLPEPTR